MVLQVSPSHLFASVLHPVIGILSGQFKIILGSSVNFVKFKTEFSDVVEINEIMVTSLCPNAPSQPTRWPARGDQS